MCKILRFPVSLSIDRFRDKQDVDNNINTLQYREEEHSTETLLYELTHGKSLCHLFNTQDVTFTNREKTKNNFKGSYIIGCDVDETHYTSIKEYINNLTLKPTLYYSTFSHLKGGESIKFRLLYVFDEMIDNIYLFRYLGTRLINQIEQDTNESFKDKCGRSCAQYFNGTNVDNPNLTVEYGNFNTTYSLENIGYTPEDYIQFLSTGCDGYSDTKNEYKIADELVRMGCEGVYDSNGTQSCPIPTFSQSITRLLYQWDRLDKDKFIELKEWKYVRSHTKYVYRIEKDEWKNGRCQQVDDDYFRLFWDKRTLKDGNKRRRNLFERMCLRRVMKPDMTKDEMVVNALIDTIRFINNDDKVINSKFIKDNVDECFDMGIDKIKEIYSKTIEYLKCETHPKREKIYMNKEVRSKQWTFRFLDEHYDVGMSVKENMHNLKKSYEFEVGLSTLYEYCKDRKVNTKSSKLSDDEIIELIDEGLSIRKNRELLHVMNIKIGEWKLRSLIQKKKDMNNHQFLSQGTGVDSEDCHFFDELYFKNEFTMESETIFPDGNNPTSLHKYSQMEKESHLTLSQEKGIESDNASTSRVSAANGENRTGDYYDIEDYSLSVRV